MTVKASAYRLQRTVSSYRYLSYRSLRKIVTRRPMRADALGLRRQLNVAQDLHDASAMPQSRLRPRSAFAPDAGVVTRGRALHGWFHSRFRSRLGGGELGGGEGGAGGGQGGASTSGEATPPVGTLR